MTNDQHGLRGTRYLILILVVLLSGLWVLPDVSALSKPKLDQAWTRVQKEGVIRFAIDASYMPFDGLGSDNNFYGIDVDIATEIAKRIGVQAQFVNVSFDSLYDVLKVGQADATISALIIDPARQADWKYSAPYFEAGLVLVTPSDSRIHQPTDLMGRSLGVEYGSDSDREARYLARRIDQINVVYVDSAASVLEAVVTGRVEAGIIDGVSAAQLLPKYTGLQSIQQLTHAPYAIAVWGDSPQLLDAINSTLSEMKQDGTIDRIVGEWMLK